MKQNKYDDQVFFDKYSQMSRSVKGLSGAGEWPTLEKMLPDFNGKRVLDLGCGFGWHCQYAVEHGAISVIGIDISTKMLNVAKKKTSSKITYICKPLEDLEFKPNSFDIVISSLTFHYTKSFEGIAKNIYGWLAPKGDFVFSVENPIFTAYGTQDWYYDADGKILHFPVDNYFNEGQREATFLGEKVTKYHRTFTTYLNTLLQVGFEITGIVEPQPTAELLKSKPEMMSELRRPMMLIVSAKKK